MGPLGPPLGLEPFPVCFSSGTPGPQDVATSGEWDEFSTARSTGRPLEASLALGQGQRWVLWKLQSGTAHSDRSVFVSLRMEEEVRGVPRIACIWLSFRERYVLEGSIFYSPFPHCTQAVSFVSVYFQLRGRIFGPRELYLHRKQMCSSFSSPCMMVESPGQPPYLSSEGEETQRVQGSLQVCPHRGRGDTEGLGQNRTGSIETWPSALSRQDCGH